jgi:hypothetical protein
MSGEHGSASKRLHERVYLVIVGGDRVDPDWVSHVIRDELDRSGE